MEPPTTDAGPRPGPPPRPSVPPGGPSGPRQLRRHPDDGHIAGVCAGLAEYFNVDPVIVRIASVVLLISGPGVFAYALAWIFVPAADEADLHANQGPFDRKDRGTQIIGIVLLTIALSVIWGDWWSPARRWIFPVALMALGGWLLFRHDRDDRDDEDIELGDAPVPPVPPAPAWAWGPTAIASALPEPEATDATATTEVPTAVTDDAGGEGPSALPWDLAGPPPVPPRSPTPTARRRLLGPIVFGALLIWGGLAWLFGVSVQNGLAVGLCLIGLGFVLGAFVGGSRALILPALMVSGLLAVTAVVDIPLSGPVGRQSWGPARIEDAQERYEVSVGEGLLDLSAIDLPAGERLTVEASVGIGHLVIVVPDGAALDVTTAVGGGESMVLDVPQSGVGVSTQQFVDGDESAGTLVLDLQVGLGQIEVTRDRTAATHPLG